ncbi:MAG: NUDIX domain-containing protein [Legionellales bacterium]|nr:NUDIX domain-containing protein [Legionellales bacterium]
MHRDDVEVIEKTYCHQKFYQLARYQLRHRLFNGEMGATITREVLEHGGAVAVLLFDKVQRQVVLVEQFRIGAYADGAENPWLLEIVAGMIEPDETPSTVAIRETLEETHLPIQSLQPILSYWPSPGCTSECIHLFLGIIDATRVAAYAGNTHEVEDIKIHVIPLQEAFAKLDNNEFKNSPAIIALQWLRLHSERL